MAAGKLPLFNQLVVATVWDHGGGGQSSELQKKSQIRCSGGGGGWGGGVEAEVMLFLLFAFWPKYLSGMLFSP